MIFVVLVLAKTMPLTLVSASNWMIVAPFLPVPLKVTVSEAPGATPDTVPPAVVHQFAGVAQVPVVLVFHQ